MKETPPSRPALSERQQALLQQRLRGRSDAGAEVRPAPRADRSAPPPLSFAQQRLWFLDHLEPGGSTYNMPSALRLSGPLDTGALGRALNEIVQRHEILRTTFSNIGGDPVQIIAASGEWKLERIDLSQSSAAEQEAKLPQLVRAEALRPFDLSAGPLARATLIRLGPREHVFCTTFHHIVSDGWSSAIFWKELAELCNAFQQGRPSPLAPLPLQYADYAVWQRRWLEGPVLEKQIAYWKERLQECAPTIELPADHSRPAAPTHRGEVVRFSLSPALTGALKNLGQQKEATLYMVLLAAFQTLLHRLSRQEDILVGSVAAGRNQTETEGLIGFFVNTLVLRTDFRDDPTFTTLLARVRETVLGAMAHQDLPFEKLVETLQPPRRNGYHPFFQTMFAFDGAEDGGPRIDEVQVSPLPVARGTAKFDLSLEMSATADGVSGLLEFDLDLFEATTIQRWAGHFTTLLQSIADGPQQRVSELPLLTLAERHQQIVASRGTALDPAGEARLHRLIEQQAARTPDAMAVAFEGRGLTYAELNRRANQLARELRRRGVGPDGLVGVFAERSFEMVVALLAVLKAGGAYVALDPSYPAERLGHLMEDAHAPLMLAQPHLESKLPAQAGEVLLLDASGLSSGGEATENLPDLGTPQNLAYVIFTSGSTGRPKGAMNEHRGICNQLLWMQEEYRLTVDDRVLQKTPYSFDASVWEFFWPLLAGARLVMARPEGHRDSAYLVQQIRESGITTVQLVPSMLRMLLDEDVSGCPSLRRVFCGGEALPHELQERFFARLPGVELHNLYGPAEAAIQVTTWKCQPGDVRRTVPIGRPVANTQVYVLDARMQPMPAGVAGELYIGGVQVGRGYVGRDDLTAERFLPDPFSTTPGARLYKTGDLARHLPGGEIEYLGRTDFQIKLRGQRIELGEIETTLDRHPGVAQCVVMAREDSPGDQRLVAYVVARPAAPSVAELQEHLSRVLPAYMVPGALMFLETLPLTSSGKVDRRALPAPTKSPAERAPDTDGPPNPLSVHITEIWKELLGLPHVGQHENFFELGGHSLLALKMMKRVEQVCGRRLPLSILFAGATVAQLAAAFARDAAASAQPLIEIQTGGTQTPLFFLHGDLTGGGLYCVNLARLLGSDQPFYVLPPQSFSVANLPTIESMAAHHLQVLRAHTPHGPYRLGGYCAAGLVALEMAHQLARQGEAVELVALIDTPTHSWTLRYLRSLINGLGRLGGASTESKVRFMVKFAPHLFQLEKMTGLSARLVYLAQKLSKSRRRPLNVQPPEGEDPSAWLTYASYIWMISGHHLKPYQDPIALYWSAEILNEGRAGIARWHRCYAQLEFHAITGDHLSSITRHAEELARLLRGSFSRHQTR